MTIHIRSQLVIALTLQPFPEMKILLIFLIDDLMICDRHLVVAGVARAVKAVETESAKHAHSASRTMLLLTAV